MSCWRWWGRITRRAKWGASRWASGSCCACTFLRQWFALSGSWRGRGAIRIGGDAPFCRHRSGPGTGAGRNEDPVLPPLLEMHERCGEMLDTVNHYPEIRGIRITTGTITLRPATAVRNKGNTAALSQLPYIPERCCPTAPFPRFHCQNSSPIRFPICRWRCCRVESQLRKC